MFGGCDSTIHVKGTVCVGIGDREFQVEDSYFIANAFKNHTVKEGLCNADNN